MENVKGLFVEVYSNSGLPTGRFSKKDQYLHSTLVEMKKRETDYQCFNRNTFVDKEGWLRWK